MKSSKFEQDKRLYAALLIGGVLIMLATLYFGVINSKAEARKAAEKGYRRSEKAVQLL